MEVTDPNILNYIRSLVIPPAYTDVEIYYTKKPQIAFTGIDSKGRKQYIYSKEYVKKATDNKFCNLVSFCMLYNSIQQDINVLISLPSQEAAKIIALVIRLIDCCNFRMGNEKYVDMYGSYGTTSIRRKHIKFGPKNEVTIEFIGKKGVTNTCKLNTKLMFDSLYSVCKDLKENDSVFNIKPIDVNNWLKQYNSSFTVKMFRTYKANVRLIELLQKTTLGSTTPTTRKRFINEALKTVAVELHHTPAICKKSYIDSSIYDLYIESPIKYKRIFMQDKLTAADMFRDYLSEKCI